VDITSLDRKARVAEVIEVNKGASLACNAHWYDLEIEKLRSEPPHMLRLRTLALLRLVRTAMAFSSKTLKAETIKIVADLDGSQCVRHCRRTNVSHGEVIIGTSSLNFRAQMVTTR
jgi:hypothetical protein